MTKIHHDTLDVLDVYAQHLKTLDDNDKATRFGYKISDQSIDSFILHILYHKRDHHLFTAKIDNVVVGFGHLARDENGWELAVSVDSNFQNQGIGGNLIEFMITWAKVHGITSLYMHCIANNKRIQHLSTKYGLKVILREGQDITAEMKVPSPNALDYTAEYFREQHNILTQILNLQKELIGKMNPLSVLDHDNVN